MNDDGVHTIPDDCTDDCQHEHGPTFEEIIVNVLGRLETKIDAIAESNARAETVITNVADQVGPTIEALSKSPLLKIMGVKSK